MSYEFSNADVCIILSRCGLERFNAIIKRIDFDTESSVEV